MLEFTHGSEYSQCMPRPPRPIYTIPPTPAATTLAIRPEGVAKYKARAKANSDSDFARVIGVNHAQMSRLLAGKAAPGARVISGAVRAFGWHALKDLFVVVPLAQAADDKGAA